ncbi:chemotaxis protein CheC [Chitinivorax tropicus]|uniref:Chemotaxis protein CheC n=1 Tax=Chitinivorax tropicus TaxID=714531 RepID=A0A840MKI7_9PROT|nr:chemotaxis protein CheC [Chitinivorax tropicus]MBB5017659.1 chemotaxis protein CheC [Chitinivorax tropicus]
MTHPPLLTTDQTDALQEVTNIAIGQAATSLAAILDCFVRLSVPRIRVLEASDLSRAMTDMIGLGTEITATRQSFQGSMQGEALVIYDQTGCAELAAELMGYEDDLTDQAEVEILLEVSNVLIGACLGSIAELLGVQQSFSPPTILVTRRPIDTLFADMTLCWQHALLVEVSFSLENRQFSCHIAFMMPDATIESMRQAIEKFMENY